MSSATTGNLKRTVQLATMLRRTKTLPPPEISERRKGGYSREIDRPERAERHEERRVYRSNTEAVPVTHERFRFYFPHRHESQSAGDEEKGLKTPRTGSGGLDTGSHAPSRILRQTNLEIVATKWVADLDDREIVTLIVKDDVEELEENRAAPGETRWRSVNSPGKSLRYSMLIALQSYLFRGKHDLGTV